MGGGGVGRGCRTDWRTRRSCHAYAVQRWRGEEAVGWMGVGRGVGVGWIGRHADGVARIPCSSVGVCFSRGGRLGAGIGASGCG